MSDPYSGLPEDLRDLFYKLGEAQAICMASGYRGQPMINLNEAKAALGAALRELVADRERLEWMESQVDPLPGVMGAPPTMVLPGLYFEPGVTMRAHLDVLRGATPGGAKEEAE